MASLLHPSGLLWAAAMTAGLILLARRRWRAAFVALGFAGITWLGGQPPVAAWFIAPLEGPYARATLAAALPADAIVILGGGHRDSPADLHGLDLTGCGDRLFAGLELARLGRAPLVLLGGDPTPTADGPPYSERIRAWCRAWGLTNFAVETLGPVRNTRDEAVAAATLVRERGWTNVLLVTSAYHLGRAEGAFRAAGMPVWPVACDFQVWRGPGGTPLPQRWRVIPQAEAWNTLGAALHEHVGRRVYRWRGWL